MALRVCTGAFRSSLVASLYAESGEGCLQDRRDKLSLHLYSRILGMLGTPAYDVVDSSYDYIFDRNPRLHTYFGYRVRKLLSLLPCPPVNVCNTLLQNPPNVKLIQPLCPGITWVNKRHIPDEIIARAFTSHIHDSHNSTHIYVDGSKSPHGAGFGVVLGDRIFSKRLPTASSVYSAELHAILFAVAYISDTPNVRSQFFLTRVVH